MRRRHKRLRRKEIRKQRRIIIVSLIGATFLFASGYAAFSTSLNINAKGNLKQTPIAINKLKEKVVSTGDGLYIDPTEENRYVYRGSNPDNYIRLDNNLFRIISIESDNAIKVITNTELNVTQPYDNRTNDTTGPRLNENNTYCSLHRDGNYWGCNAWSATDNLVGKPSVFTNGSKSGTVTENSSLNNYLNITYYGNLSNSLRNIILNYNHKLGFIDYNMDIPTIVTAEKNNLWTGHISIQNLSDFLLASTNNECQTNNITCGNAASPCSANNYLFKNRFMGFLDYIVNNNDCLFTIYAGGGFCENAAYFTSYYIFPTFFLSSNIKLTGFGTENNPYEIYNN